MNPLRRLFLGPGTFGTPLRAALLAEGPVFWEEGLPASVVLHNNYRAPGHEPGWEKTPTSAAVAVTPRRVVVWARRAKHIELPLTQEWPAGITVRHDRRDQVVFAYDAGAFHTDRSGDVEVRLRTRRAAELVAALGRPGVDSVWSELVAEDLLFLERGLTATVTRHDGAPAVTLSSVPGRPERVVATVGVSRDRFVVLVGGSRFVNVPRREGRPAGITVTVERRGVVTLDYVATSLPGRPRTTVDIETPRAAELGRLLGAAAPSGA